MEKKSFEFFFFGKFNSMEGNKGHLATPFYNFFFVGIVWLSIQRKRGKKKEKYFITETQKTML